MERKQLDLNENKQATEKKTLKGFRHQDLVFKLFGKAELINSLLIHMSTETATFGLGRQLAASGLSSVYKYLYILEWAYINNSPYLARKYARIFVRRQYLSCPLRRETNSFNVSFELGTGTRVMSKDKYPSIFYFSQMMAIVFILQIFFATCASLKIGEYHSDIYQF